MKRQGKNQNNIINERQKYEKAKERSFGNPTGLGGGVFTSPLISKLSTFTKHIFIFFSAFLLSLLSSSLFASVTPSIAVTNTDLIRTGSHYLTISHNEEIALNVIPTVTHNTGSGSSGGSGGGSGGSNNTITTLTDTINVKQNLPNGYSLFLSMNSSEEHGNRLYLNNDKNSPHYLVPTTHTNTNTTNTLDPNSWGYSLTGNLNDYHPVPKKDELPLALIKTTNSPNTTGEDINLHYATNTNLTTRHGTYKGTLLYSAIANINPDTTNTLTITPSSTTTLTGGETITIKTPLLTNQSVSSPEQPVTITIGNTPCTNISQTTNPNTPADNQITFTCTTPSKPAGKYDVVVNIPKYNQTYTRIQGFEYKSPTPTFFTITDLQQMTSAVCNSATTPTRYATTTTTSHSTNTNLVPERELRDTRDSKTYIVRKLADGKCWMTQNLDLDLSTGTPLNNQNTDLNSKSSWTPNNSTQTSAGTAWDAYTQDNRARSHNPGEIYYTGTGSTQSNSSSGPKYAHIGNYYNWYAATAGSGTYSMSSPGQTAPDSICPKGWKLPYGNNQQNQSTTGDYRTLTNTYGITSGSNTYGNSDSALLSSPLHFVRSGAYYYSNGQVSDQGSNGYVWSSSVYNRNHAHYLLFSSSYVYPQHYNHKGRGFSVRCLAR